MAEESNTGTKTAEKKGGFDMKLVAGALAIIVIAAAIYAFYGAGIWGNPPVPLVKNTTYGLNSTEAQLFLASFNKTAAITDYNVTFSQLRNGLPYEISEIRKGDRLWIRLEDVFAPREGFFTGENDSNHTDVVCLTYGNATRCAKLLNNGTIKVATDIKSVKLGDRQMNLEQGEGMRKLIGIGAVRITGPAVDEKVGNFDTKKISYTFDLQHLSVKELVDLGLSPTDQGVLVTAKVTYWIDTVTGMMVKSDSTQMLNGSVVGAYSTEYSALSLVAGEPPLPPAEVGDSSSFVKFYSDSQDDFLTKETCKAQPTQADVDACYKAMGVEKSDWELCKRISDKVGYVSCTMIVAQNTKNHALCEHLNESADDCYIAIVGENGNAELCKKLTNESLSGQCALAAAEGKKKVEDAERKANELSARKNCVTDSNCSVFAGAVCAPKNSTPQFTNESNPYLACFSNLPCGCSNGFCAYQKNETYYKCVSDIDEAFLNEYINKKVEEANATNSTLG
ncbi:MAG: hypothetical protein WCT52_03410 [Candidatus Micrarchaeia archaeon]